MAEYCALVRKLQKKPPLGLATWGLFILFIVARLSAYDNGANEEGASQESGRFCNRRPFPNGWRHQSGFNSQGCYPIDPILPDWVGVAAQPLMTIYKPGECQPSRVKRPMLRGNVRRYSRRQVVVLVSGNGSVTDDRYAAKLGR